MEYPYMKNIDAEPLQTKHKKSSNFIRLANYYKDCFKFDKTKCEHSNIRFHYTDIRQSISDLYLQPFLQRLMYEILLPQQNINVIRDLWIELKEEYPDEIKRYSELKTTDDFIEYGLLHAFKNSKLFKQQENIKDVKLKKKLLDNLFECVRIAGIRDIRYDHVDHEIMNEKITNMAKIDNITEQLASYLGCFMDLYLLSRMFREFKNVKEKYSKSPKYIVIVAGDWHIVNYREILEKLGFERVFRSTITSLKDKTKYEEEKMGEENCVDISDLKLPLFSDD